MNADEHKKFNTSVKVGTRQKAFPKKKHQLNSLFQFLILHYSETADRALVLGNSNVLLKTFSCVVIRSLLLDGPSLKLHVGSKYSLSKSDNKV